MDESPPITQAPKAPAKRFSLEWVAAVALGLAALSTFAHEMYALGPERSAHETALYNALEFVLTLGFTWFSTRAISRSEFEESLKRFAISAYRRVADIDRLVQRLQGEVRSMIRERLDQGVESLRIVEAMVTDTHQVVRSSIADWADVIGDELLAIERIKRLEQERHDLRAGTETARPSDAIAEAIDRIESRINTLRASLPPRLQLEAEEARLTSHQQQHAAEWVKDVHEREGGMRLTVVTGKDYQTQREQQTLTAGERLQAVRSGEDQGLDVVDRDGKILGRLQNSSPLDYDSFARAVELCFGPAPLPLEFMRVLGHVPDGGGYGWFEVRVMATPILVGRRRRRAA